MWTLLQFHEIYVTNWRAICVYEMYLMTQGCIEYHKLTAGMVDRQAQKHTQLESRRYQRWQYKPQPGRYKNHWKPVINHGWKTGEPSLVQDVYQLWKSMKSILILVHILPTSPEVQNIAWQFSIERKTWYFDAIWYQIARFWLRWYVVLSNAWPEEVIPK